MNSCVAAEPHSNLLLSCKVDELDRRLNSLAATASYTLRRLQEQLFESEEINQTLLSYQSWLDRLEDRLQRCESACLSTKASLLCSTYDTLKVCLC